MQRWTSLPVRKIFLWDKKSSCCVKVRDFCLVQQAIRPVFVNETVQLELNCLSLCSIVAGGEGEIKWQKDREDIDDEDIVSAIDETSSKLVIKKAKLEDSGKYTCLCEYDSGHRDDIQTVIYVYGMQQLYTHSR